MGNGSQEAYTFRVTNKFIAMAATALVAVVSAYPLAYKYSAPAPVISDRYTGTEGTAHEARTSILEQRLRSLEQTKGMALGRISKLEVGRDNWAKEFRNHVEWNRQMVREFSVSDAKTAVKLDECLHRTGLK